MLGFQVFLLIALAGLFVLYIRLLRTYFWDRMLVLLATIVLGIFFLHPDWSTVIANALGIGRGADFLFYLSHVLMAFLFLFLRARVLEQANQITSLARVIALQTARPRQTAVQAEHRDAGAVDT